MRLGRGRTKRTAAIHTMVHSIENSRVFNLIAVHALSGCDTTSKVVSKLACLNKSVELDLSHISGFGKDPLDQEMMKNAEKFLLRCLNKQRDAPTFDDY